MVEVVGRKPFLIGILVDVSGSMQSAIGSSGTAAMNRLEAFSDAFERLVQQAASSVREISQSENPIEARLFAYGFGFGNILSSFLGKSGPPVRDLLAASGRGERTVDVVSLADNWRDYLANVRAMAVEMFGNTPMREAFERARARIAAETANRPSESVLFVLSDGEPTDGEDSTILPIVQKIRDAGCTIVSCFVTASDITEPKRLYGEYQDKWPAAAKLMFECASALPRGTSFHAHLQEQGWIVDPEARLFAQVNQSEMLREFLDVVLSPLREHDYGNQKSGEIGDVAINVASAQLVRDVQTAVPRVIRGVSHDVARKELLLFLHGLGGRAEATWGRMPEFLLSDPILAERFAVGFYSFPASLFRVPFSTRAPKVQELAAGLRTQINHEEFEQVNLICHSLGGLIARRYLIEEVKAGRPLRVKRLALLAVPNNGAGLASAAKFVSWRQNQIKQLCRDADLIEFLNEDWFRFEVQDKIRTKFIFGTQDQVVDRFSVAGFWGNPDVETIVGRGHIDIVKPEHADDLIVRVLRRFLIEG